MRPLRVFISYSHSDRHLVQRLVNAIAAAGMTPMWDKHLRAGVGFSKQIQHFIVNCHIFLPFLTKASAKGSWQHQEIGFAFALGKRMLPVSLVGPPEGIISDIQAVELRADLSDARTKLSADRFVTLINEAERQPAAYECTADNTRRALMLADHANSVSALSCSGPVRQIASLTTFHLPNRGSEDPVWNNYFAGARDDLLLFEALQAERIALEKHAGERGCQLILDPAELLPNVYKRHGIGSVRERVRGLLSFLRGKSVSNVVVAINSAPSRDTSLTLVGDWFSSEAVSSGAKRVLKEAVFTRNAPVVWQQVRDFDNRLTDLLAARRWDARRSRREAISYLQAYLDGMPDRP
jgi:hypothetical protein